MHCTAHKILSVHHKRCILPQSILHCTRLNPTAWQMAGHQNIGACDGHQMWKQIHLDEIWILCWSDILLCFNICGVEDLVSLALSEENFVFHRLLTHDLIPFSSKCQFVFPIHSLNWNKCRLSAGFNKECFNRFWHNWMEREQTKKQIWNTKLWKCYLWLPFFTFSPSSCACYCYCFYCCC